MKKQTLCRLLPVLIWPAVLLAGIRGVAAQPTTPLPLTPYPQHLQRQSGELLLPQPEVQVALPAQLAKQSQYLLQHLSQRLSAQAQRPVSVVQATKPGPALLQIDFQQMIAIPKPGDDESYRLAIGPQQLRLQANTSTGVLYGLESMAQLLDCTADPCRWPQLQLQDAPRFGWRGLLLDSARRFIPLADLKRQLQGMASAKLNVLHWHLTDDQGWRFASQQFPGLTAQQAPGEFYSQSQMRELVAYAARLGIRVVPEIDLPGHASEIARAYPQLMAAPGPYAAERRFGVFAPVLDVSSAQVHDFIAVLLAEVVQIFPDPYLHIGGDEVNPEHWLANSKIRHFMQQQGLADAAALHADFNRQLAQQLAALHRRMMGWDEVLHRDLPKSVLVQSWQGQDAVAASVRAGHTTLLSAGYYLDQPMPTSYHYRQDPVAVAQPLPALPSQLPAQTGALELNFSLQRLNQKPVTGQLLLLPALTLAGQPQAAAVRWQVPQRGLLAARQVQHRHSSDGEQWLFQLDSWLGPGDFRLQRSAKGEWQSSLLLGNTPYQLQIVSTRPITDLQAWQSHSERLSAAQQSLILGGEAALWSELVPASLLDLKLWPRLYAVAERLWSPASQTDELQLELRLPQLEHYAAKLGLQQRQQQQQALQLLTTDPLQLAALQLLTEVVEPSHYYSRHHLKTVRGQYQLDVPLDRLADALPAESLTLLALNRQLQQLDCRDNTALTALQLQFQRWQQAAVTLRHYQGLHQSRIQLLAQQLEQSSQIAQQWLAAQQRPGTGAVQPELSQWQDELQQITAGFDEEILALAQSVQLLLGQCQPDG